MEANNKTNEVQVKTRFYVLCQHTDKSKRYHRLRGPFKDRRGFYWHDDYKCYADETVHEMIATGDVLVSETVVAPKHGVEVQR